MVIIKLIDNTMKSKKTLFIGVILLLDVFLNLLVQLMPNTIKNVLSKFSSSFGVSYTMFWLVLTTIVVLIIIFISIKGETFKEQSYHTKQSNTKTKRVVKQYGAKSTYIENNNGDLHIN